MARLDNTFPETSADDGQSLVKEKAAGGATSTASVDWPDDLWPGYQDELLTIFRMIDADDNGVMDFSELLDLGKGVSASFTATKCYELLGRMDDDSDGTLSQAEFLRFFGKVMAGRSRTSNDKGMVQIETAAAAVVRKNAAGVSV